MSIQGGLDFIKGCQRNDGGFWEYVIDETGEFTKGRYRTTFTPSLISLALQDVQGSEKIRQQCAEFLLSQKSPSWSWNYWARSSEMVRSHPYPDDLDDTFLALSALWQHDEKLFSPSVLAAIAQLLFATETAPGGPYRTWLVDGKADKVWQDVDPAVNTNIGAFLALQNITLPGLTEFVEETLTKGKFTSPYYPKTQPMAYFLSRWYRGESLKKVQQLILAEQKEGIWQTPQITALMMTTLLRVGYPADKLRSAAAYIAATQAGDGSWKAEQVCVGHGRLPSGAASLTTAFCLEALVVYEEVLRRQPSTPPRPVKNNHAEKVVSEIKDKIGQLTQPDLRKLSEHALNQIVAHETERPIVELPWIIAQTAHAKIDTRVLQQLAMAGVWGWMAYTIYDDFLDNEGDPRLLPSAVFGHRQLLNVLHDTLTENKEFHAEIEEILDKIDQANAWEVNHCRAVIDGHTLISIPSPDYGDYSLLADRSLGHIIAPIGVLYGAGASKTSLQIKALKEFFHHYLIARQLNDDAHDWEEDLMKSHINAVGALILQKWAGVAGHDLSSGIDLKRGMKKLHLIMWESVIDDVCRLVEDHLRQARAALLAPELLLDSERLLPLLEPIEASTKKALKTRDEALEFISSL